MWTYNDIASQLETLGIIKTICKFVRIYTLPLLKLDRKVTKTRLYLYLLDKGLRMKRKGTCSGRGGASAWGAVRSRLEPVVIRLPSPKHRLRPDTMKGFFYNHRHALLELQRYCTTRRLVDTVHAAAVCKKFIYYVICTWAMQLSPTQNILLCSA